MDRFKWMFGGIAGGVLGAILWGLIVYLTGREIGYMAIGVGFAVGFGMRLTAQEYIGITPGVTAAFIAVLSIAVGKVFAIMLITHDVRSEIATDLPKANPNMIQMKLAREIVGERVAQKKRVGWAYGKSLDTVVGLADFPKEIVKEATTRWDKLGTDGQTKAIAEYDALFTKLVDKQVERVRSRWYDHLFQPIDILFFIFAILAAFRLGSNLASD